MTKSPDELRAIELTGGCAKTLGEAIDQWEMEREALAELFDENQALTLSFRHFDMAMVLAERVFGEVEKEAALFVSQGTRDKIAAARDLLQRAEGHRLLSRELVINATERRTHQPAIVAESEAE